MNITESLQPSTTRNHPTIGANHFTNTASSSRLFRDYCFGKEYEVADRLVSIIDDQHLDGIDLDYEYCYILRENKQDNVLNAQRYIPTPRPRHS